MKPVDISVPGVPKDKLSVYCDNGKIVRRWIMEVFPTKVGKAKVSVSAEIDEREEYGFNGVSCKACSRSRTIFSWSFK